MLFHVETSDIKVMKHMNFGSTVDDWDSMGRVVKQTHSRAFQTLNRAFSFLLNPQKFGREFQRFGCML